MKRVAILVEDDYQELELWYPLLRFKEAGWRVTVVGPGRQEIYHSKLGYPVKEDLAVQKCRAEDFDAVIVPGGYAPDRMRRVPAMIEFVRAMHEAGRIVAAICHGPQVLISAGVLRGRRATCFFSIRDDLVNAGAEYIDAAAVVDGNVITSRVPEDLPAFCRAILESLHPSGGGSRGESA